jgi:hypothetical protein
MLRGWPVVFLVCGLIWWLLDSPFAWGWLLAPMFPGMPISVADLVVLATLVVGLAFAVRFALENA